MNQNRHLPKGVVRRKIRHINSTKQMDNWNSREKEDLLRRSIPMFGHHKHKAGIEEEEEDSQDFEM